MLLVTGGAGFIGSNFILQWLSTHDESVLNIDALTYAGNPANLADIADDARYHFIHGNILDEAKIADAFERFRPRAVIHFAAESHVDRSISGPHIFVQTNVSGTTTLLGVAHRYWLTLSENEKKNFRFINISTDEVYGSMSLDAAPNKEVTPFDPSSPYSASKAAADQFGRAYWRTYRLPVITVRCTNNFGPRQFPEKLIPSTIVRALAAKTLPIYGSGLQIRDWIHVNDYCRALERILSSGRPGEVYNVGANNEQNNLSFVQTTCRILDQLAPRSDGISYATQISHVDDRPGHDQRYALDTSKIRTELGWQPTLSFQDALTSTIAWYLDNPQWVSNITTGNYSLKP